MKNKATTTEQALAEALLWIGCPDWYGLEEKEECENCKKGDKKGVLCWVERGREMGKRCNVSTEQALADFLAADHGCPKERTRECAGRGICGNDEEQGSGTLETKAKCWLAWAADE